MKNKRNNNFEYGFDEIVGRMLVYTFLVSILPTVAVFIIHLFYKKVAIIDILPDMFLISVAVAGNIIGIITDKEKNHDNKACSVFALLARAIMILSLTTYIGIFVENPISQAIDYQLSGKSDEIKVSIFAAVCLGATILNLILGITAERISFKRKKEVKKEACNEAENKAKNNQGIISIFNSN